MTFSTDDGFVQNITLCSCLGVVLTSATSHFTWESFVRSICLMVSFGPSSSPLCSLPPFSSFTSFPTSHGDLSFASIRVPPDVAVFLELGWADAQNVSCLSSGVLLPCLVVNAALCRHMFQTALPSRVGRLTASDCATLWVFPIQMCGIGPLSSAHCVVGKGGSTVAKCCSKGVQWCSVVLKCCQSEMADLFH